MHSIILNINITQVQTFHIIIKINSKPAPKYLLSITQMNNKPTLIVLLTLCLIFSVSYAQLCATSQYFNAQRCAPCKSNCQCSSDNSCDDCLDGYAFDATFSNCFQCPLLADSTNIGCKQCCSQISGTSFVCSQCDETQGYVFLRGGQCLRVQGCTALSVHGLCTNCVANYYLQQGKCQPCDISCQTCMDSTLCLTCKAGYFNETDIHQALCSACPLGCSGCTSAAVCTACTQANYFSTPNCLPCGANCLSCTSIACLTCDSISTLISGVCHLCTDVAKSGTAGCTSCVTSGASLISCTTCADTYYLNNGACTLCSATYANSIRCTATKVLQCKDDYHATLSSRYHLVSGQCVANTKMCKSIKNTAGDCYSCYFQSSFGYYRLNGNTCTQCAQTGCSTFSTSCQCLSCLDGYRYVNSLCNICQNLHCIKCQDDVQSCQQCAPYYGRFSSSCNSCSKTNCINCDGDYTVCAICDTGYYLSSGECYSCQTNCLQCQSSILCTSCASGYYLQSNGRCQTLPNNCVEVDSTIVSSGSNIAQCKKCEYGYQVILGNCYPCSRDLFNLGECEKFCPTYYALLAFDGNYLKNGGIFALVGFIALLLLN